MLFLKQSTDCDLRVTFCVETVYIYHSLHLNHPLQCCEWHASQLTRTKSKNKNLVASMKLQLVLLGIMVLCVVAGVFSCLDEHLSTSECNDHLSGPKTKV